MAAKKNHTGTVVEHEHTHSEVAEATPTPVAVEADATDVAEATDVAAANPAHDDENFVEPVEGKGAASDEERAPEINYMGILVTALRNAPADATYHVDKKEERIGRTVAVNFEIREKAEEGKQGDVVEVVTLPRQTLIQGLFEEAGWHRRAITDLFGDKVPYQIIFAATKNMENQHHKSGSTASPGVKGARRGKEFTVMLKQSPEDTVGKEGTVSQSDYARALAGGHIVGEEKLSRKQIAEKLGIAYGTVYQATKDLDLPDGRKEGKDEGEVNETKAKAKATKDAKAANKKPVHVPGEAEANSNRATVADLEDDKPAEESDDDLL